jgi:hypothetical protein
MYFNIYLFQRFLHPAMICGTGIRQTVATTNRAT